MLLTSWRCQRGQIIERRWVVEGRAPVSSGLDGCAAWPSMNARLAERQMATNMLSLLGKHWQFHPKGLSPCQLEDISTSLPGAKASVVKDKNNLSLWAATFVKCIGAEGQDTFTYIAISVAKLLSQLCRQKDKGECDVFSFREAECSGVEGGCLCPRSVGAALLYRSVSLREKRKWTKTI